MAYQLSDGKLATGSTGPCFSFFLQAKSGNPKADAEKLASTLKPEKTLDTDGYVDYQRDLGNGATLRVVSTENKESDLYVGCTYQQDAS